VRINSPRTRAGLEDLLALAASPVRPDLVAVPKVESAAEIEIVHDLFAEHGSAPGLLALVETLRGIERLCEIVRARGVIIAALGTGDLAAEMGVAMDWEPMLLARMQLVQAARAAGIHALDGAWPRIDDPEGLAAETRRAAALGYSAKVCLHPAQVAVVHDALRPTEEEAELARGIVAAFEAAGEGAIRFRGRMIDRPVVEAARRTLARQI
jgi:citrate lyase beta subunit